MKLILVRFNETKDRTHGHLLLLEGVTRLADLWTLELPWRDNECNVSRIPTGTYRCTPERHAKLGWVLRVHDVPGRSGILIHGGSYPAHTHGCVLVGQVLADLDNDGLADASRSRAAMTELAYAIKEDATLYVVDCL